MNVSLLSLFAKQTFKVSVTWEAVIVNNIYVWIMNRLWIILQELQFTKSLKWSERLKNNIVQENTLMKIYRFFSVTPAGLNIL